ncbi:MAG: hypothetical protein KDA25_01150 [Phycisphaerales bacterium]|nr:hypothetical protein [Phycisphaerales bacterium]
MNPRSLLAIMLAGGIRRSPLATALEVPTLCVPLRADRTLLDIWLDALAASPCAAVLIVVTEPADVDPLEVELARSAETRPGIAARVIVDPRPWRGTAGVVRDVVTAESHDGWCAVIEVSCPPPAGLDALWVEVAASEDGCIGVSGAREPAGQLVLPRAAIDHVPEIGFFDLKEQLLPALAAAGRGVTAVEVCRRAHRIRDRRTLLAAIAAPGDGAPVDARGSVVAPSASIGPAAFVSESVVMGGAVIPDGAIVSRSIIGPGVILASDARIVDAVVGPHVTTALAPA